jgi:hypothetical protein
MTAVEIIQAAKVDGVTVSLSPDGTIDVIGKPQVAHRWHPILLEHKIDILHLLSRQAVTPPDPAKEGRSDLGVTWAWTRFKSG